MKKSCVFRLILASLLVLSFSVAAKVKVVTTFSDFASITKELGGDLVDVDYLSHGDQDPHFVPPKPSLALKLKKADMLISTGLDLEMWLTTLQDKARNAQIMDGADGYVAAAFGIDILEKPETYSRTEGDVHVSGNPHVQTSPLNWKVASANILTGLKKVDPAHAETYEKRQQDFVRRVNVAMYGDAILELFEAEQLDAMLIAGTLFEFLENEYESQKLIDILGGWLKKALPLRNKSVVAYHKNWSYLARDFGLNILGFIEPKPGIPPTPKHVEETINLIKNSGVKVMLVANYFEQRKPTTIADKTGITALFLPVSVGGAPGTDDNFKLMDYWLDQINAALAE